MHEYFCYDGSIFDTFATLDEAKAEAAKALSVYRDEAPEGWPEEVHQVCYGQLRGAVVEAWRRPRNEEDFGMEAGIDVVVEYELREIASVNTQQPS